MNINITNASSPSPTLPRKRERECALLFLPLSRLRGRESREARRLGASTFREDRK
ncbi:hypothetical protein HNQ36_004759 [Afipia massiliensis]|uniref:Uncharacterized protein n=1 Tax=Afipia massiliensis TaxID=211460 RepID=A0A840N7C7_9BRAD|nr:hypothetical protein [Afipia massiliensis]